MMESDFGEYPRYWHGDVVLIRFLLLFFDVKGMRFIGMIVQFILVFMAAILIREKAGNQGAWMFGLSYILMMPETMATCSIFIGFDIILISLILLIRIIDRSGQEFFDTDKFMIFYCVAGALMCYFDRIVICIMGWIIPTVWMLYLFGREEKVSANIRRVISSGVSWLIGFAGCWMCKLCVASVYSGKSIFETAQERAELWTGADGGKLYGLWLCSKHYLYPVFAILICGFLIYLSIRFITGGLSKNNSTLGMLGVAAIPLAWLIVMSFHAGAHHFFAYRIFGVALSCGMILLLGTTGEANLQQFKSREGIAPIAIRTAICVIIMLISLLVTSTVRESEDIQNADIPGYYTFAEDADKVADTVFRPAYRGVTRICMGIYTENETGSVRMELYENGIKIDEKEYPAEAFVGGRWSELDVDWHFKKGSEYMIRLDGENTEGKFGVYVPYEGGRMLDELTGLNLSGRDTGTAPMAWIVYRR
ncbi:MAG: hypothetical protein K6G57_08940 [Lachnospiraceae bacterium]|nr:hypothetical protein [Lachnospiraceae bacterium]